MRSGLAALALLATCVVGCSDREHANPLDPANPGTRGRPVGFVAIAGDNSVELRWQPIDSFEIEGFQIFRRAGSSSDFEALTDMLSGRTERFSDFGLSNGVDYHYRIYYVIGGAAGGQPAEAVATPGPQLPWITDFGGGQLFQLSPDTRHVIRVSEAFLGPTCLQIDRATRTVWFSDTFGGRVGLWYALADRPLLLGDFSRPAALAVDPRDHGAWIADEDRNMVFHYRESGDPGLPSFLAGFELPIALAIDPNDGALYVCESIGNRVRSFAATGTPRWSTTLLRPSRVAVDSTTREVWVTSFSTGRLVRFSAGGAALDTIGALQGPIGVAVDARRGRIWVAEAAADAVVVYDRAGTVLFRVGGIREAREVAIDFGTGNGWVTAPGEGSVVRISSGGALAARLTGFVQPYDVTIAGE